MLTHMGRASPGAKVVVLGSRGFIGRNLVPFLQEAGFKVDAVSSQEIDLTNPSSVSALAEKFKTCDHLIMLSCLTPDKGKGQDTLMKNILMAKHVCDALALQDRRPHVVYFSSDSVYSFEESLIQERMMPSPVDIYGAMHRLRELMFMEAVPDNLAIIRPTLVYGPGDTHNSYGPNRFRREAFGEGSVTLFGAGEDTRAHIFIDDLVKLTLLIIQNKSIGILNGAPDTSITYGDLAVLVGECLKIAPEIKQKSRAAAPTHRYFETSCCYEAFPGFTFTSLEEGLAKTYEKMLEDPNA